MKGFILLLILLLIIGLLKLYYFANLVTPPFDAYDYLLMAKSLWYSHSPVINLGINNLSYIYHEYGYPLLIALFYPFFHDFEISARFVVVAASSISIFLVYLIMEKIKKGCGKYAALFMFTSPLFLWCSTNILRDLVSFCLICLILYLFYVRNSFNFYKTILLGILISYAFLVYLFNAFLLVPFLYLLIRQKKWRDVLILLGVFSITAGSYAYLRLFRWPWSSADTYVFLSKRSVSPIDIFTYLKAIFMAYMRFEPLIIISGIAGAILILKKRMSKQYLIDKFWGVYLLSALFVFFCWFIRNNKGFGGSYLFVFFFPLILTGSLYLDDMFTNNLTSARHLKIRWIGINLILINIIFHHWKFLELLAKKIGADNPACLKWNVISLIILSYLSISLLLPIPKRIFSNSVIFIFLIALSIQASNGVFEIAGRYKIFNRGKQISPMINALKGRILPESAFFIGIHNDPMAIFYYTGYPTSYEDVDRIMCIHSLGEKWNEKNMVRIEKMSTLKPVICVYDHVYSFYLKGLGREPYEIIQEKYENSIVFSNLGSTFKIYVLDNTSNKKPDYINAIEFFSNQLRKKPYNTDLLNYLGWAYFCSGKFDQAINIWNKKVSLKKDDPDAYNNIGLSHAAKGEYREAILSYEKALEFKPLEDRYRIPWAKSMIYFNLAQACEKANEKEKAVINWKKYLDCIPSGENYRIMNRHIAQLTASQ